MQQTFPAGTAQKIVISNIADNVFIKGQEQQTINVETRDTLARLQPEGDTLYIDGCDGSLKLTVPFETQIVATNIEDNIQVESVRQVELHSIGDNAALRDISGNITLEDVHGDVQVKECGGEVMVVEVSGDLVVNGAAVVRTAGDIAGDVSLSRVARAELERVESDLVLDAVEEALIGSAYSDVRVKGGIASLRCGNVGNDCNIVGNGNAEVILEQVGNDLRVNGVARFQASNIGNDCQVDGNANSDVQIGNIGNSITVIGAARVQLGNVGNDCMLRDIQGDVTVSHVGSDLNLMGVGGRLRVGNIGSDAQLRGVHGSILAGNVGSDLYMQADFPPDSATRLHVGGDATVVLPDNANLRLNATAGGRISGRSIVSTFSSNVVSLVYGEGAAQLDLHVGGDLSIRSGAVPNSSSSSGYGGSRESWGQDFGRQWSEFGREMERMGRDLGREINDAVSEATSSIGADIADDFTHSARGHVRHAHRRAEEEISRAEEKARRASERAARFNIRIHNREWHMDSDRLQRIIDQARRAADEGVLGALEAVEQALSNLHIQTPPRPTPPPPPTPGTPPMPTPPPAPGAPPTPEREGTPQEFDVAVSPTSPLTNAEGQPEPRHEQPSESGESQPSTPNIEQERLAILRMIAEGRITPEEGDLLLEALGE